MSGELGLTQGGGDTLNQGPFDRVDRAEAPEIEPRLLGRFEKLCHFSGEKCIF